MRAWVIRPERLGDPAGRDAARADRDARARPGEVLVRVMAAGVNYNGVWASLGLPVSIFRYTGYDFHIAGSDASGIVERVGPGVTRWKPGDEVVIHCNQSCGECPECNGLDPMACTQQKIWAYESNWGSFAEYCKVQAQQLLPQARAADVGGGGVLRAHLLHRLPHAGRPGRAAGRRQRAGLGRRRRPGHVRGAAVPADRRQRDRGRLVRRQDRAGARAGRQGDHRPARLRALRSRHGRAQLRRGQAVRQGGPRGCGRQGLRHRVRARRRSHLLDQRVRVQAVRQDRDLRRHLGLQARLRRALPVDAAEVDHRQPLRQRLPVRARQPADRRGQDRAGAVARCSRSRSARRRTR